MNKQTTHSKVRLLVEEAFAPLLLIGLIVFATTACTDRIDLPPGTDDDLPAGMVRVKIDPRIASADVVASRTASSLADAALTGEIRVLVFNGNGPDAKLRQKATATYDSGSGTLTAVLNEEDEERWLCVVANLSTEGVDYIRSSRVGATFATIQADLVYHLPATNAIASPLPMSGWSAAATAIKKAAPVSSSSVALTRAVARIDVTTDASGFAVHGAQLANGARFGYILPREANFTHFGPADLIPYAMQTVATPAANNALTDALFCFENQGHSSYDTGTEGHTTRIVIWGAPTIGGVLSSSPSYYPIDVIYPDPLNAGNSSIDIERNKLYTIKLTKVAKDGYRTYEEAARSEAFNNQIDVEITVTDPYAHDITTNGKQYLGVTNAEFVLYPLNTTATSGVSITEFTYTCDAGWAVGEITLPPGISFVGGTNGRLDVSTTATIRDLVVNIDATFTAGTVVLHIGNLRKEIQVRRMAPTAQAGGVYANYFASPSAEADFVVGEVIAPSAATAWLKLSTSAEVGVGGSSLSNKVVHPEGGIYIHVEPNIGFDGSAYPRQASLYLAGDGDNQRIKVFVQQDDLDVYSDASQINPFSYVGTFHRWNETSERLIRIDASKHFSALGSAWWEASVVVGREFIVVDKEDTYDNSRVTIWKSGGVEVNAFGVGDNPAAPTSAEIESSSAAKIVGGHRSVSGLTGHIYFRVGMTGRLSGPQADPRYGLIALSYGSMNGGVRGATAGVHLIYVRQGEAADYLMRPWDASQTPKSRLQFDGKPSTAPEINFASPNRPMARKFTPYNLTDPEGGTAHGLPSINRGAKGYFFVDHPSQGGYYFAPNSTDAKGPGHINGLTGVGGAGIANAFNFATMDGCPRGYRRPNDGATASRVTTNSNATDIVNSETRQSLFLYPRWGIQRSNFSNQLRGYLADGYFDRRPIEKTVGKHVENDPKNPTNNPDLLVEAQGVVSSGVSIAYWGFLVFNPNNYASFFLPLAGVGSSSPVNAIILPGGGGVIQTASPYGAGIEILTLQFGEAPGDGADQGFVFDNYRQAGVYNTVRCIKDEQPIVGSEGGSNESTLDDIKPDTDGSLLAIRHLYMSGSTLQAQIEAAYSSAAVRERINSIAISGIALTDIDYAYLNDLANDGAGNLRHLIIRGAANASIPAGAFTSTNWSSIALYDATNIANGAFGDYAPANLTLGCLDAITITPAAFTTPANTKLHLNASGSEYKTGVSGNTWSGITWRSITGYY